MDSVSACANREDVLLNPKEKKGKNRLNRLNLYWVGSCGQVYKEGDI